MKLRIEFKAGEYEFLQRILDAAEYCSDEPVELQWIRNIKNALARARAEGLAVQEERLTRAKKGSS